MITLRGKVARRLIDARGGPGSGPNYGHPQTFFGKGGSKTGGHVGAGVAAAVAMSDAMEMLGDPSDPSVDLTGDSLSAPTEIATADLEQFVEAHADLWARDGAHLLATIDPKKKRLLVSVVKFTSPSASATSRSTPPPVHPIEFAAMGKRSVSHSLFPPAWGPPPHELRTREAWILEHCEADARGDVGKLVELRARYLVLSIAARRFGPGES